MVHLVRREVLKLPKHWRGVLWLHRIEERPIREVAAMLGIGVMAAKSRLFWAHRGLKRRLKRLGLILCVGSLCLLRWPAPLAPVAEVPKHQPQLFGLNTELACEERNQEG